MSQTNKNKEKFNILKKLWELEKQGYKLSNRFDMSSSYEDIEFEYELHTEILKTKSQEKSILEQSILEKRILKQFLESDLSEDEKPKKLNKNITSKFKKID